MIISHTLTWVRSLDSPIIFETLKDCNESLVYYESLLEGRLTQVSDFFARERARKKIKKFSKVHKNIFKKFSDFSPEFP